MLVMHKIKPLLMIPGSQKLNGGFLNNGFFLLSDIWMKMGKNYNLQSRDPNILLEW